MVAPLTSSGRIGLLYFSAVSISTRTESAGSPSRTAFVFLALPSQFGPMIATTTSQAMIAFVIRS
jgi:hypothetical protein